MSDNGPVIPPKTIPRILIADDNKNDCRFLELGFKSFDPNAQILVLHDSASVLELFSKPASSATSGGFRPNLLVLDLHLPDQDGFEVVRILRGNPDTTVLPIVLLTSACSEIDIRRAYALRANTMMLKPQDLTGFDSLTRSIATYWFGLSAICE